MNIKKTYNFVILFTLVLVLSGCANSKFNKPFKHNTPLIKTDIKKQGKAEVAALSTAKYLWNFLSGIAEKHNLSQAA